MFYFMQIYKKYCTYKNKPPKKPPKNRQNNIKYYKIYTYINNYYSPDYKNNKI